MDDQINKSEKEQILGFINLCLRHWYYFVISMFICCCIAFLYITFKTPLFEIRAQVVLRQDDPLSNSAISNSQSLMSAFGFGNSSSLNVEDESMKMASQGYVKQVVREMELNKSYIHIKFGHFFKEDLYDQSPVVLITDPAIADTLTKHIDFTLKIKPEKTKITMKVKKKVVAECEVSSFPTTLHTGWGDYTFDKSPYYNPEDLPMKIKVLYSNYDYSAQVFRENLTIDSEKKSSGLINLILPAKNVVQAKKILSTIIDTYNTEWDYDKNLVNEKTEKFINTRLELVKAELLGADTEIKKFKEKYNLTDIEADVTFYMTIAGELQASLLQAETQSKMVSIIEDYIQDKNNKYSLIPFSLTTADPSMADVINLYNEQLLKRNEMYRTNQQGVFAQSLDNMVESQRKNLLQSLDNVKKGLDITLGILKKKENDLTKVLGKVPNMERDFIQLKREQELQQTIYIFLLEKREELGVRSVILLPKLKVIDDPYLVNEPLEPSLIKVALATLFLGGIIIPISLIYLVPYLKTSRRKKK